jgi:flagellar basal-body rod modification protein FlgD
MTNLNLDLLNQLGLAAPGTVPAPAAASGGGASTGSISDQLNQSDFLKLMTTQLNNQDPTSPMDSSQFLAQIAQFASVSGIQDMQSSISQLVNSFTANQTMQAASLIGHQVIAKGSNAPLSPDGALVGAINLPQDTSDLVVGVYDGAGQLVRKLDLGPQYQGLLPFDWDGVTDLGQSAPSGLYTIKAIADVNGASQAMDTYVASTVDSVVVDPASNQLMLNTSGGETIKMSDVKQIM